MVCRYTSPYIDSLVIGTLEAVDCERLLSIMFDCYCRLLELGAHANNKTKVDIDLC